MLDACHKTNFSLYHLQGLYSFLNQLGRKKILDINGGFLECGKLTRQHLGAALQPDITLDCLLPGEEALPYYYNIYDTIYDNIRESTGRHDLILDLDYKEQDNSLLLHYLRKHQDVLIFISGLERGRETQLERLYPFCRDGQVFTAEYMDFYFLESA